MLQPAQVTTTGHDHPSTDPSTDDYLSTELCQPQKCRLKALVIRIFITAIHTGQTTSAEQAQVFHGISWGIKMHGIAFKHNHRKETVLLVPYPTRIECRMQHAKQLYSSFKDGHPSMAFSKQSPFQSACLTAEDLPATCQLLVFFELSLTKLKNRKF